MKKNLNILYYSNISDLLNKNSSRAGILFVAYNILKELAKRTDVRVTLYAPKRQYNEYKKVLKEYFPNDDIRIIINGAPVSFLTDFYYDIKDKRTTARTNHQIFLKHFYQLLLLFCSPIYKLTCLFSKLNIFKYSKFDCIFSTHLAIPKKFRKNKKIQKYTMLHDMIPLLFPELSDDFKEENGWFRNVLFSLNSKDFYFANSEYTKQDFLKYNPINPDNIKTTLLACNENFYPRTKEEINKSKEKYGIPLNKKYIFSLCSIDPRKNLIRAVKTFFQFVEKNNVEDFYFVLGGGYFNTFIEEFNRQLEDLKIDRNKILKIGYVDDEDLPALYSGAEWFIYTSQYEGFGLPPLEAMSCGCPVITSNNSSLPEVVGDVGIMIDWDSDEQHAEAYEKYYFDSIYRQEMAQKGLERAKQFSWGKCANTMIENMFEDLI